MFCKCRLGSGPQFWQEKANGKLSTRFQNWYKEKTPYAEYQFYTCRFVHRCDMSIYARSGLWISVHKKCLNFYILWRILPTHHSMAQRGPLGIFSGKNKIQIYHATIQTHVLGCSFLNYYVCLGYFLSFFLIYILLFSFVSL